MSSSLDPGRYRLCIGAQLKRSDRKMELVVLYTLDYWQEDRIAEDLGIAAEGLSTVFCITSRALLRWVEL
jgi:hypothetical protein